MSTYGDSYRSGKPSSAGGPQVPSEFVSEYPSCAAVLAGIWSDDGKECQVPPASIIVFAEGGKLKFCISPKVGNMVAFGTCEDSSKGLGAIEAAIEGCHFEWKKARR